jgi:hypothetical protein
MKTMITSIVILSAFLLLFSVAAFAGNMLAAPSTGDSGGLPKIKFLSIKTSAGKNIVSWKAEEDLPAVYYEVESSSDSLHFKTIGMVLGPKPATDSQNYFEFWDAIIKRKTKIYYRVKQINAAGEVYYTGIIKSADQEK